MGMRMIPISGRVPPPPSDWKYSHTLYIICFFLVDSPLASVKNIAQPQLVWTYLTHIPIYNLWFLWPADGDFYPCMDCTPSLPLGTEELNRQIHCTSQSCTDQQRHYKRWRQAASYTFPLNACDHFTSALQLDALQGFCVRIVPMCTLSAPMEAQSRGPRHWHPAHQNHIALQLDIVLPHLCWTSKVYLKSLCVQPHSGWTFNIFIESLPDQQLVANFWTTSIIRKSRKANFEVELHFYRKVEN
jgi:hypothetical protein